MAIENIPIRATITFEDSAISISTPYVMSFNVNKSRGQAASFSASIKVNYTIVQSMKGRIYIEAGPKDAMRRIFTGYIKSAVPSPCWDDPAYFVVNISGVDELFKLENRRFTRRQLTNDTSWAIINDVVSQGTMNAKLKYTHNRNLVTVADNEDLKDLTMYDSEKEKKSQEPKPDTNSPKDGTKPSQKLEASIGYINFTGSNAG